MKPLFEILLKIAGYDIAKAIKELVQIQVLSALDFNKWQVEQKWKIARHHYDNNISYRNKIGNQFPHEWTDLPIMKKSDYQEDLEKLLSKGYTKKNTYISNTSGSSGHPFYFAKNKSCHARTWAIHKQRFSELGLSFSSLEARFFGAVNEHIGRSKEKIKDRLMNRIRFNVFDLSDVAMESFIRAFKKNEFDYVYGYTQTITIFSEFMIKNNIVLKDICPSIKTVIVTAELCSIEDRILIGKGFGVPVKDDYGASEVGLLATECDNGRWHIIDENVVVEVDEDGKLLVTDLFNEAEPFIRYSVGDKGTIDDTTVCQCGSHRRILSKLKGRENDIIVLPSGKIAPGLTFYYVSKSILESTGILREFIIRQTSLNTFIFDIVADRELHDKEVSEMKDKMDKYLEPGLTLIINKVPKIKRPDSGKIKHFYSEI
jgi:phenylacetate-CoA ligase